MQCALVSEGDLGLAKILGLAMPKMSGRGRSPPSPTPPRPAKTAHHPGPAQAEFARPPPVAGVEPARPPRRMEPARPTSGEGEVRPPPRQRGWNLLLLPRIIPIGAAINYIAIIALVRAAQILFHYFSNYNIQSKIELSGDRVQMRLLAQKEGELHSQRGRASRSPGAGGQAPPSPSGGRRGDLALPSRRHEILVQVSLLSLIQLLLN
jgi:hypothetical protein